MILYSMKNAQYINENGWIDLILETDDGDMPFTYNPWDDSPVSMGVRDLLDTITILPYVPKQLTLDEYKENKIKELAAARWDEMQQPAEFTMFPNILWDSRKEVVNDMHRTTDNMRNAIAMGEMQETDVIYYKTYNNVFVPLTLQQLIIVRLLLAQREQTLYAKEKMLVDAVLAATTIEKVSAIVW